MASAGIDPVTLASSVLWRSRGNVFQFKNVRKLGACRTWQALAGLRRPTKPPPDEGK